MSVLAARRDTSTGAVATALVSVAAVALLVRVALHSDQGQQWDDSAMRTVVAGRDAQLTLLSVLGYVSIGAILAVALGCAVVALLRGRPRIGAAAATVLVGANLTTQLLKESVLDRPDFGLGTLNSLPSGHTTVVASAVGASLLVAPGVLRPVVALVGGFAATLTGASTVVAGWHRPADVMAALAISLFWTAAVAAVILPRKREVPPGTGTPVKGTFVSAAVGCVGGLGFLVAIGVRPAYGWVGFTQASLVLGAVTAVTALFVVAASAVSPSK
ncbi:MAG: phosphatase PAP2 family protein [Aeromicrobium sp.]